MSTEFISNSWLMPTNANAEANRVSNFSLDFDGATQFIDLGTTPIVNGIFSISMWIKRNSTSVGDVSQVLIGKDNLSAARVFNIFITKNTGVLSFWVSSTGTYSSTYRVDTSTVINDTNWHNVVFLNKGDGQLNEVYIDGTESSYTTQGEGRNTLFDTTSIKTSIGADALTGTNYNFNGKITEVSIFDYALSASQVTQLYGTGSAIGNPMAITNGRKPIAYYPLGNAGFNGEFLTPNSAEKDYVFDFDNDTINPSVTLSGLNITDEFSVSLWTNVDTITSFRGALGATSGGGWTDGFGMYINASKWVFFVDHYNTGKVTSSTTITTGTWIHLVGTFSSSGTGKLYVNGTEEGTPVTGKTLDGLSNNFGMGNLFAGGGAYQGMLSNVQIWNKELISSEVTTLYNYGTPYKGTQPQSANLQGWWELDASATFDGSNWSVPDASSNSNTGTSSGMTAANLVQSDLIINAPFDSFSLNFDGIDGHIDLTEVDLGINSTLSFWLRANTSGWSLSDIIFGSGGASSYLLYIQNTTMYVKIGSITKTFTHSMVVDNWYHMTIVRTGDSAEVFQNGVSVGTQTGYGTGTNTLFDSIGARASAALPFDGQISNISAYNSSLTSAQVTTLYNEGKPFDLNTFAVTPTNWWRLGATNSSFDGTNWTVLDEVGTTNGTSENMIQSDLVDGVGATGSGTSSGMSSGTNRTGNSPYSENNAVSYNMSVTAKSTSTPT